MRESTRLSFGLTMNVSKNFVLVLTLLLSFVPGASGLTASFGTDGVSSSHNYDLDDATSFQEADVISGGTLFQSSELSGSGNNVFSQQVSGDGYVAKNAVSAHNSGKFSASTSTAASNQNAFMSLSVTGRGDLGASVYGMASSASTGQEALVLNGDMVTSQSIATALGVSTSSQNTGIAGDGGAIGSKSLSPENNMAIVGGFSNPGNLNTELTSVAADRSAIYGTASLLGEKCIDNEALQAIASGGLAMETSGIYLDCRGDLGTYGLTAMNVVKPAENNIAYQTTGWQWPNNPQIHILLSGSNVPPYLDTNSVAQEISKAANTWDLNTEQNLFRGIDTVNTPGPSNAIEMTTYVPTFGIYKDGTNVQAWTYSLSSPTIAEAITWYDTSQPVRGWDGKLNYQAVESDTWYNSNYGWRIATAESPYSNSNFDVRTIATHELGHTIGLEDLYSSGYQNQMMYGSNNGAVKWYLRNGDKMGLWSLYGP